MFTVRALVTGGLHSRGPLPGRLPSGRLLYGAAVIGVVLATSLALPTAASAVTDPTPTPTSTVTPDPTPTPDPVPAPAARSITPRWGSTAATRNITLRGTNLGTVTAVKVGHVVATNVTAFADRVTFSLGTAWNFRPAEAAVVLTSTDATTGATSKVYTSVKFSFRVRTAVDRQLRYAFDHWNERGSARYVYIPYHDCANFASQALVARGWKMTGSWYNRGGWKISHSWASSTGLADYLKAHPSLGKQRGDTQRSKVKIGDLVQFDWDRSGDRDHTATVSRITTDADGHISIFYVAHTGHVQYGSVDAALKAHRGARVYYWSLR